MMKKSQGFSIIELMIVVAIIGVVMSMAIPAFGNLMQRNRLKSAVQSLQDDLQFARVQAIKRSQNIAVSTKSGNLGAWCYGLTVNATCDCDVNNDGNIADTTCEIKTISGAEFSTTNLVAWDGGVTEGSIVFDFKRGTATPSTAVLSQITFSTADFAAAVSLVPPDATAGTTVFPGRVVSCDPGIANGLPTMPACSVVPAAAP